MSNEKAPFAPPNPDLNFGSQLHVAGEVYDVAAGRTSDLINGDNMVRLPAEALRNQGQPDAPRLVAENTIEEARQAVKDAHRGYTL